MAKTIKPLRFEVSYMSRDEYESRKHTFLTPHFCFPRDGSRLSAVMNLTRSVKSDNRIAKEDKHDER